MTTSERSLFLRLHLGPRAFLNTRIYWAFEIQPGALYKQKWSDRICVIVGIDVSNNTPSASKLVPKRDQWENIDDRLYSEQQDTNFDWLHRMLIV